MIDEKIERIARFKEGNKEFLLTGEVGGEWVAAIGNKSPYVAIGEIVTYGDDGVEFMASGPSPSAALSALLVAITGGSTKDDPITTVNVDGDFLKPSTTARGFGLLTFTDRSGTECTLQESSLATEAAIWFGAAKLEVKRFPGNYTGWHDVDFAALLPGQDIVGNERMHLTQDHVRSLIPALQHFAETGELATAPPVPQVTVPVDPTDAMIEAALAADWECDGDEKSAAINVWHTMLAAHDRAPAPQARPLSEWHEEYGFVTWWKFPVNEPSYIGSPLCDDWPGYHTHWTPHPDIPANAGAIAATEGSDNG